MWDSPKVLSYETRLRMTNFCRDWQSICWGMLKTRAILASPVALVIMAICIIIPIGYYLYKYRQRKLTQAKEEEDITPFGNNVIKPTEDADAADSLMTSQTSQALDHYEAIELISHIEDALASTSDTATVTWVEEKLNEIMAADGAGQIDEQPPAPPPASLLTSKFVKNEPEIKPILRSRIPIPKQCQFPPVNPPNTRATRPPRKSPQWKI